MFRVTAVQCCASGTPAENLARCEALIDEAMGRHPDTRLLCLPELAYWVPTPEDIGRTAEEGGGPWETSMAAAARRHGIYLVAGSYAERAPDGRAWNTCPVFDPQGRQMGVYRKTHLMDAMHYRESDSLAPGDALPVFAAEGVRFGVLVCYDLRFPEVARTLALDGAVLLVAPSAFPTGDVLPPRTDHWDVLLRASAIVNQAYVLGANQFGGCRGQHFFGRSQLVDPWGTVVAQAPAAEGIVSGLVDPGYARAVRERMPVLSQRRRDLYRL